MLNNLKHKLIFLSIFPVAVALALFATILFQEKKDITSLRSSMDYIEDARVLSKLIHALQLERGCSIGCLSKERSSADEKQLEHIRASSDKILALYERHNFKVFDKSAFVDDFKSLGGIREDVMDYSISYIDLKGFYTRLIVRLLDSIKILSRDTKDAQIGNYILSYHHITSAKESLGRIRAMVNRALMVDWYDKDDYHQTLIEKAIYQKFSEAFLLLSTEDIVSSYKEIAKDVSFWQTFGMLDRVLQNEQKEHYDIDHTSWFAYSTRVIDLLRIIEDEIFDRVKVLADNKLDLAYKKLALTAVIALLSIVTLLITLMIITRELFYKVKKIQNDNKTSKSLLEQYSASIDASSIVSRTDKDGIITYVNDEFCKVSGYTREEIIGKTHAIIRHKDTPRSLYKQMWHTIKKLKQPWQDIIKNRTKDGGVFWARSFIYPITENGEVIEYLATRIDITQIVEQKSAYEMALSTDSLTGVHSRYKLQKDIEELNTALSLAIINVDRFREINDFYGHSFGDKLLIRVANILKSYQKKHNELSLYRLQADEFAVLGFYNKNFIEIIEHISQNIKQAKFDIDDENIVVSCSCGISHEANENIFSSANMALKLAKSSGEDIVVYSEDNSLNKEYENNIKYTNKLTSAIENDRLVAYYQPIVDSQTQKITKYESLIRLIDEDGLVISPFFFLDIAKRSRKYFGITKAVLHQSFEMFKDSDFEFSINLSIKDISDKYLRELLLTSLKNYEKRDNVIFELVESESIENFDMVNSFVDEAHKLGAKIAIDDFGTGYSNFEHLAKLQADYLKIDGSLIKNILKDKNSYLVVSAIVRFAKTLNMKCVAEFVEDKEIYEALKELDIEYAQGYYFGEPKPTIVSSS